MQIGKNTYTVNETIDDIDIDTSHGQSYSFIMEDKKDKTKIAVKGENVEIKVGNALKEKVNK